VLQQYFRHQLLQLCDAIQQQQAAAGSSSNEGSDDAMSECLGSPELHSPGSAAGSSPDRLPGAAHGARWVGCGDVGLPWLISAGVGTHTAPNCLFFTYSSPVGSFGPCRHGKRTNLHITSTAAIFSSCCFTLPLCWGSYVCRQGAGAAAAAAQLPDPQALLGRDWCAAVAATAASLEDLGLAAASEEAYTAVINRCAAVTILH
jgi:hypothetical protein